MALPASRGMRSFVDCRAIVSRPDAGDRGCAEAAPRQAARTENRKRHFIRTRALNTSDGTRRFSEETEVRRKGRIVFISVGAERSGGSPQQERGRRASTLEPTSVLTLRRYAQVAVMEVVRRGA